MICIYDCDVEVLDLIICGPGKDDELDEWHRKDEGKQRAVAENADKFLLKEEKEGSHESRRLNFL